MNLRIQCWVSDDLNCYCEAWKILFLNYKSYLNPLFDIEFGWRIRILAPIPEIIFFLPFFLLYSLKKVVKVWSQNCLGAAYCLPGWWRWISLKAPSSWSATERFWHSPGKGEKGTWWPVCKMERSTELQTLWITITLEKFQWSNCVFFQVPSIASVLVAAYCWILQLLNSILIFMHLNNIIGTTEQSTWNCKARINCAETFPNFFFTRNIRGIKAIA